MCMCWMENEQAKLGVNKELMRNWLGENPLNVNNGYLLSPTQAHAPDEMFLNEDIQKMKYQNSKTL